jgi:hypothetical protein
MAPRAPPAHPPCALAAPLAADDGSGPYPDFQLAQWGLGYWILNMNQQCYSGGALRTLMELG